MGQVEYDGSSWSSGGALITGRSALAGAGTQDAGLAFGGLAPSNVVCTEEYTKTDGFATATKSFGVDNSTGKVEVSSSLESTSDIRVGTYLKLGNTANTGSAGNLWYDTDSCTLKVSYESIGPNAWSSGGALITARDSLAGAGTQTAGLAFGGFYSPDTLSCTEEYDGSSCGSSWSSGGALITARCGLAGAGTQTAGLAFGGYVGGKGGGVSSCTEEYDGSAWTSGGALITARFFLAGAGTQTAGLAIGGTPSVSCTEEYNGSSWSSGGALITARCRLAGAGTQTAGLAFGGSTPSNLGCTEEYGESTIIATGSLSLS